MLGRTFILIREWQLGDMNFASPKSAVRFSLETDFKRNPIDAYMPRRVEKQPNVDCKCRPKVAKRNGVKLTQKEFPFLQKNNKFAIRNYF